MPSPEFHRNFPFGKAIFLLTFRMRSVVPIRGRKRKDLTQNKDRHNGFCLKVVTHQSTNPARLGLTSELVCLPSLFSIKTPYFLVAVQTCTHWVPIVAVFMFDF